MADFFAARFNMASTLMFHIIFAAVGVALPWLVAVSHYRWLRTGDKVYRDLTQAWSKGVAIFFATGAVSGTVVTFQLGLLWPTFMEEAGSMIGFPLALEGAAFFVEAVALGLFLYGWNILNKWVHFASVLVIGIAGVASAMLVMAANSWINFPTGYVQANSQYTTTAPFSALFTRAWLVQSTHMVFAAFVATGFAVAGIHAIQLLRNRNNQLHRKAIVIAMVFAAAAAILQIASGDASAKSVAQIQPVKLAAMESLFETTPGAPLVIGGIPDLESGTITGGIEIPGFLSFLAYGDPDAVVMGLNDVPRVEWPPVTIVHFSFQAMVGIAFLLAAIGVLFLLLLWRWKNSLDNRPFLWALALATPLGVIAMEAGWLVTEVGRQPWIIEQLMRTSEALTPMPGQVVPLLMFLSVYAILFAAVAWLMTRQISTVNDQYRNNGSDSGAADSGTAGLEQGYAAGNPG